MVLNRYLLAILLVSILSCLRSKTTEAQELRQLFDGKTLNGWKYDPQHWRVENGAIVGEIAPGTTLNYNTWIVWDEGRLRDFDLRLQVRLTGKPAANSGIQIRCQAKDTSHVSGYQADLDMGATWLGRIYDEHGRALITERGNRVLIAKDGKRSVQTFAPALLFAPIFRENDWNDYRIVGIGERIAVFVNGTLFADLVDKQINERDLEGQLAFQLHSGPETKVEFREIKLEELSGTDSRLGSFLLEEPTKNKSPLAGSIPEKPNGQEFNLGFESGNLDDWKATGDAFQGQPVANDTIGQRWSGQVSNKQGKYFIGGYEISKSDKAQGTLTSQPFEASQPYASFLIAGGSTPATRVDVLSVDNSGKEEVLATASGQRREQMRRVVIDLRSHQGKQIAVRLVDNSSGGWGHLNFDDFRLHDERPLVEETTANPLFNPLLHHLKPVEQSVSLSGETISKMSVPEGFTVDLVAAEPNLHQPMAFTFDGRGRLWVVEGHCYPTKRPAGEGLDRVLIFEDTNNDGSYDSRKVFIEGLNLVSGMQVGHGGVWIGAAPELLFIPDRNADDIPDSKPIVLLDGWGYADTHETLNSFTWGPDGWLYGNQGVFNQSRIGKPGCDEIERIALAAGVWRYHPTRHEFEVFAHGGSNQWGLDFDDFGQLFMTHCRSNWGRGLTTHVIQGAHYWNQINSGYKPFISANPVAGLKEMRNYMLASARYGHGEGGAGKRGSRALYGGHSHVGTMLYLGDNWPSQFRNHLFTHNLHGHRINHQVNERLGSGFNTVHAGFDVFQCSDPQYIGVDLQYGPDGAVYFSDWYDPRHCHSPHPEQWQRGNGRMYRMRYIGFSPAKIDYHSASDLDLAAAQLHANDWHVRAARLVLAERAARGPVSSDARQKLVDIATSHRDANKRLRGLWALHVCDMLEPATVQQALQDEHEYVRAWAVQLLAESQEKNSASILNAVASKEQSPVVRLYLASAATRLPPASAWNILETLAKQPENAEDRNLPILIWHSLARLVKGDVRRSVDLIDNCSLPTVKHSLSWFLPQVSTEARELMIQRIATQRGNERKQNLQLVAAGLSNSRNLPEPNAWSDIAEQLYEDPQTRSAAIQLGVAFNDKRLFSRMRLVLDSPATSDTEKKQALSLLANSNAPSNLPVLLKHIDNPKFRLAVIQQLGNYNQAKVAQTLLLRLSDLVGSERDAALQVLTSRAVYAKALLAAIGKAEVPKSVLTGYYARQMSQLNDDAVDQLLAKQWGRLSKTSAERSQAMKELVALYNKAPLWAYNRNNGLKHFNAICATCHVSREGVERIGPKLEGTGSKGLEYIVENVMDPNAVIGEDFLARTILTSDDQVISGVITKETDTALTVRTSNASVVIAKDDIEVLRVSESSFMPEELLKDLSEREKIELLMYLMSL